MSLAVLCQVILKFLTLHKFRYNARLIKGVKTLCFRFFFSDKCIVHVLSPLAAGNKFWISDNGTFFQSASIYVRGNWRDFNTEK